VLLHLRTSRETRAPPVSLEQVIAVLRQNQLFLQDLALRPDVNDEVRRMILDRLNGGEWFPDICVGVGNTIVGGVGGDSTADGHEEEMDQAHAGMTHASLNFVPPVPLPFPHRVEFPGEPEELEQDRQPGGSIGRC